LVFLGRVAAQEDGAQPAEEAAQAGLSMTQLARSFPRHRGSTILYVNFDGWSAKQIHAFSSTHRARDVQDILFRTAQIFAPFDVQVRRASGDGVHDRGNHGNSTIFVGAHARHVDGQGQKYSYGFANQDFPSDSRGPNSRPYDIGYVDPVGQGTGGWTNTMDNVQIAQTIAHEAGHTFGLSHVLGGAFTDVMSYNSINRYFANRTLPITDLNNTGTSLVHQADLMPHWRKQSITQQNSFSYLWFALGHRPAGSYARVADSAAVDRGYKDGKLFSLKPGQSLKGATLRRWGDYHVFRLPPVAASNVVVRVEPMEKSQLNPVILAYDKSGQQLIKGTASRTRVCTLTLPAGAAHTYQLVVGAVNGSSTGAYHLTVHQDHR
jgi:hypothetical protein